MKHARNGETVKPLEDNVVQLQTVGRVWRYLIREGNRYHYTTTVGSSDGKHLCFLQMCTFHMKPLKTVLFCRIRSRRLKPLLMCTNSNYYDNEQRF